MSAQHPPARGMNNVGLLVGTSALIYALLALLLGVFPGIAYSHTAPTPGLQPFSAAALRGRRVYVGEGCAYCHTQQVRPLAQDRPFGRPSVGGDYAYSTPELLGSERTGPDLANIGARQPSDVWQEIHLYEPRALVAASIMPSYRWLFRIEEHAAPGQVVVPIPAGYAPAGKVVVATPAALDLVAYLDALKQPALPRKP